MFGFENFEKREEVCSSCGQKSFAVYGKCSFCDTDYASKEETIIKLKMFVRNFRICSIILVILAIFLFVAGVSSKIVYKVDVPVEKERFSKYNSDSEIGDYCYVDATEYLLIGSRIEESGIKIGDKIAPLDVVATRNLYAVQTKDGYVFVGVKEDEVSAFESAFSGGKKEVKLYGIAAEAGEEIKNDKILSVEEALLQGQMYSSISEMGVLDVNMDEICEEKDKVNVWGVISLILAIASIVIKTMLSKRQKRAEDLLWRFAKY